jgi:molybdate transport system permease protein
MCWLSPEEWAVIGLSARVAVCCTAVVAIPGIACGWLLARTHFAGKSLVDAVLHAPLVMPPVVTGYLLLELLGRKGLLGGMVYRHFGFTLAFTWKAAVVASAVMGFPLMVRAVRIAIEMADPKLEAAARCLGAGPMRTFLTITLPLARPGIITGLVLAFARSLGEFGATIVFAGNIQGETRTLPLAVYSDMQVPGGDAAALRLVLVSICLSLGALVLSELTSRRHGRLERMVE